MDERHHRRLHELHQRRDNAHVAARRLPVLISSGAGKRAQCESLLTVLAPAGRRRPAGAGGEVADGRRRGSGVG
jgi:hypothetical protein